MTAADFELLLANQLGATGYFDLVERLRDDVNYRTIKGDAVAWLADVIGLGRLVRALVDGGLLLPVGKWSESHPKRHYFHFIDEESSGQIAEMWARWAAVTKALAEADRPVVEANDGGAYCVMCSAEDYLGSGALSDPARHKPDCPWRMAREAVDHALASLILKSPHP